MEGCNSKPDNLTFDFIKILAHVINNFQQFSKMKNNLTYVEMVKVLQY
jgi:hypothetical protein